MWVLPRAPSAAPEGAPRGQVFGLIVVGIALLACGGLSKDLEAPQSEQVSFVFGHIDMEDAPTDVDVVTFERVAPRTEENFYNFRVDDGTFYAEYIPPGSGRRAGRRARECGLHVELAALHGKGV